MDIATKVQFTKSIATLEDLCIKFNRHLLEEKPLDARCLWAIIEKVFNGSGQQRETISDCCAICMDETSTNLDCTLSCGHGFHQSCISRWQMNSFLCPMCRQPSEKSNNVSLKRVHIDMSNGNGEIYVDSQPQCPIALRPEIDIHLDLIIDGAEYSINLDSTLFEGKPVVTARIDYGMIGEYAFETDDIDPCRVNWHTCHLLHALVENLVENLQEGTQQCEYTKDLVQYWMYGDYTIQQH